jgi:hypothetical protein
MSRRRIRGLHHISADEWLYAARRFAQAFLEPCRDLEEEPLRALVEVRAFEVLRLP